MQKQNKITSSILSVWLILFTVAICFGQNSFRKTGSAKEFWIRNQAVGGNTTFFWTDANAAVKSQSIRKDTVINIQYGNVNTDVWVGTATTKNASYGTTIDDFDRILYNGSSFSYTSSVIAFWIRNLSGDTQTFYYENGNPGNITNRTIRADTVFEAWYALSTCDLWLGSASRKDISYGQSINNGDRIVLNQAQSLSVDTRVITYYVKNGSGAQQKFYWLNANGSISDITIANNSYGRLFYGAANPDVWIGGPYSKNVAYGKQIYQFDIIFFGPPTAVELASHPLMTPEITVSPNPSHGTVKLGFSTRPETFSLINIHGACVKDVKTNRSNIHSLNVKDLPNGLYYLKAQIGGKILSKPLMILK